MTSRFLKLTLIFLSLLSACGVSSGQSLYDVVISLSDRQRVVNQRGQVGVYLANQNKNPGDTDQTMPTDAPIDWIGVGTSPTQSAVDGLGIGGKIALLNQAAAMFEKLAPQFLNASEAEFNSSANSVVGSLQSYAAWDFHPLPRATPENYHDLIGLLAQRVRALRLITWQAAFETVYREQDTFAFESVDYHDPHDDNNDDNYEPYVKLWPEGTDPASIDWKPDAIGPGGKLFEGNFSKRFYATSGAHADVQGSGTRSETPSDEVSQNLRSIRTELLMRYPESVKFAATATGAAGNQIGGSVFILRRSDWNQLSADGLHPFFEQKNQAGHVVVGSGNSGSITLFAAPPTAAINGTWVHWYDDHETTAEIFVPDGYKYLKAYREEGSYDHWNSYEQNWKFGCSFTSVFKPTFTRGVDEPGMRSKLETADSILADNQADGKLLLSPRPGLLFGIQLGPGLKGAGSGLVSCGSPGTSRYGSQAMPRFDSTYSLQFAGSCSDYHVVYENDRPTRTQSLPVDAIGWPRTDPYYGNYYDTYTLYQAWDSPRLKQVASRDLVADVEYNSSHYGGYTVKIYRRPTGSNPPTPGQVLSTGGMTLIRTWTFSHPGAGTTAHPTDAEKLEATGSSGEKYQILANHILTDWEWGYWYSSPPTYWADYFWQQMEGTWSWTVKALEGTAEKYHKEISINSLYDENWWIMSDVVLNEYLDGQQISNLSSMTLDPFSDQLPSDWQITSAGKTITGTATLGAWDDRASGYGKWPTSLSIQYDGIQPDASFTWDANGLLSGTTQGPWSMTGAMDGAAYKQTHKLNSAAYATNWTEFTDGGNKVKTYSAPDGNAASKSASSVAWSEIEYGTATTGLPGLPLAVRNSDATGTTFGWNASSDGSYTLTLEDGLLSGSSVSRGTKLVQSANTRGFPTQSESYAINGGTVKTGGATYAIPTAWGMPKKSTDFRTGLDSTWNYAANLSRLSTHTSYLGISSQMAGYDVLGRPGTVNSNGINAAHTYTAFSTTAIITGGATGSITDSRDTLGRLTSSDTTWNGVTDNLSVNLGASSDDITRSQSSLGTYNSSVRKGDGSLATSSGPTLPFGGTEGTALVVDGGLFKTTSELGNQPSAYQTTWTDAWGRIRKTTTPTGDTQFLYSDPASSLQSVRTTEPSGRKLITESDPYNSAGAITRSGIDVDGNGTLGTGDRYVESITTASGGSIVTTLSSTENNGLREILRTIWAPAANLTITTINGGEEEITRAVSYAAKTVTTTSSKGWSKTESFNNLGLTTDSNLSGAGIPAANLHPVWRADRSLDSVSLTIAGETHAATFKNDGTLDSLTAPGRGNILQEHSISNGQETLTVDNTSIIRKLDGTLQTTNGDELPGKTQALATSGSGFTHTTTPATGAPTTVGLNAAGAPESKNYAAGSGESRQYFPGGLIEKVSLARSGDLTFGYSNDGAKDLTSATWPAVASGPFTLPSITQGYGYDLAGRIDEIGDSSGVRGLTYQNSRLTETTYTSGALSGYRIVRGHDSAGRDTGFDLYRDNRLIHSAQKARNGVSGEVSALASGNLKVVIDRNNARQITGFEWGNASGTFVPTVNQRWQRGGAGRLLLADNNNTVSGAPTFDYKGTANDEAISFDPKGRRLKVKTAGADWTHAYSNGMLISASHPALGSFSYQFDAIGRRKNHTGSGNWSNLLNQTLDWENSQNKTLKISAASAARVWVGIGTAAPAEIPSFTGSYSYPITPPGASGGWVPWNTLAVLEGQGDPGANPDAKAEKTGAIWVPPVSETFTYDAAGNRESSALWDYGWNAKNELIRARTKNYNSAAQGIDVTNDYDAEGRRFSKKVKRWQNGGIVEQKVITFIHDGNDLIYEREQLPSGLATLERKYVWGPDIAGGNAGGAGGLLLIRETKGDSTIDLYPLYDGTGHVIALADSSNTVQAEYAYGPFGETIYARGPKASSCPFRYATKYYDEETGLYNFGRRFLDPITGQWLSREPLGESESINLYSYCGNDPVNFVDVLGLAKVATDGRGNLTTFGKALLTIAKDAPEEARALLMAAQVQREETGANIGGLVANGDGSAISNVLRAIETVVGNARTDGRDEWRRIAAETGASRDFDDGDATQQVWTAALFADYAPAITASANAAASFNAARRAASDKQTAYQNSPGYKLREIGLATADIPMHLGTAIGSGLLGTDITTGSTVTWNGWANGGGFGLGEVSPGERIAAAGLMFLPMARGGSFVDDFARAGMGGRSLKMPSLNYGLNGTTTLGETMANGKVFLRPGLSRAEQISTLRHESVHAFLSVRDGAPMSAFRQKAGMWGYNRSHLLMFTEEAIAEGYATRSIRQGILHPLENGYGISIPRLGVEAGLIGGGIGGAWYLGNQWGGGE